MKKLWDAWRFDARTFSVGDFALVLIGIGFLTRQGRYHSIAFLGDRTIAVVREQWRRPLDSPSRRTRSAGAGWRENGLVLRLRERWQEGRRDRHGLDPSSRPGEDDPIH